MTTFYVDPQTLHNPGANSPPATWGDAVRDGLEFLFRPPSVKASRSATQAIGDSTWTAISFTAADSWDTDAFHNPGANPSRFTVPTGFGGIYRPELFVSWAASATGSQRAARFAVNGGATDNLYYLAGVNNASNPTRIMAGDVISLVAGDYLEFQVWQNTGGSLNLDNARATLRFVSG